ncbi:hypothetical protein INH39_30800 [Massilia violaceinigra]|uniref:Uncharacterized protein n=1 Tax=Massilia violaceinigra TaxID=2045208 RepID=A0ABY4A5Q3_9BURK|nr:hypothetical protein [Massilia violaceinigra]UOD29722.1 hypothetical protein INH39_30800 [Massilia violaceinigra]
MIVLFQLYHFDQTTFVEKNCTYFSQQANDFASGINRCLIFGCQQTKIRRIHYVRVSFDQRYPDSKGIETAFDSIEAEIVIQFGILNYRADLSTHVATDFSITAFEFFQYKAEAWVTQASLFFIKLADQLRKISIIRIYSFAKQFTSTSSNNHASTGWNTNFP